MTVADLSVDRRLLAKATAYNDAMLVLLSGDFDDATCCGASLTSLGKCQHRPGHPTIANVAIDDYPEYYTRSGKLKKGLQ